jgi:hypothetical protein
MVVKWSWIGLSLCTMGVGTFLSNRLTGEEKSVYLPGETSHGHYQIEAKCESCHTERNEVASDACLACHRQELEDADDSHPPSKFLDPRNASLIERLDARRCDTCHVEHRPMLTNAMGVTLPDDYCYYCHQDVGDERPSHVGLEHDSCQSAGCHNFHDNRGLNEDFLEQHMGEPTTLPRARLPLRVRATRSPLSAADVDVPVEVRAAAIVAEWERSAHARARVNCSGCHGEKPGVSPSATGDGPCIECHSKQSEGFRAGHHGMRVAVGLPAMRTEQARLKMTERSAGRELNCRSCHPAHEHDLERAAVDGCLECHADSHSLAYRGSPHDLARQAELEGRAPEGSGVACAACHLPRVAQQPGAPVLVAQHNQNDNLRPNEKMLRSVCVHCHGLGFAIDALADASLVRRNFRGRSARHVQSMDWVERRRKARATRSGDE